MIRQIEEKDTKGGFIIPQGKFKGVMWFQKERVEGKSRR
jgi:hypothetical protein